jgi:hypothetical protein
MLMISFVEELLILARNVIFYTIVASSVIMACKKEQKPDPVKPAE